ncbi:MAG: peptide MFS transporter [Sphingomonadaceae bacterium]
MATTAPVRFDGWLGHPRGLFFLAFTEMWERFSFYGMRGLLILYMVQELLLPGRIENIAGMDAYRGFIEGLFGELSTQAFASQTFGLYSGFVYFTPLLGGLIADRWLGAKRTVMIGIALMTAGHFAMIFDWSFLIALVLLVLGSGCLKGNIAAQVGQLYPKAEEALRSRGYAIFSTGINIGAVIGPLVCGALAQVYGWHFGFGTAGVMMLVAAIIYFAGLHHFAQDRAAPVEGEVLPALTGPEKRMLSLVIVVLLFLVPLNLAFDQMFNVGLLWVADRVALDVGGFTVPVPWFASEDSLASVLILPVLLMLWRWQARRGSEPHDIGKMAIGGIIMAASAGTLALGSWIAGDGKVSIVFPVIAFFLSGVSFMYQWPTALALVSRRSPQKANAMMMAGVYLIAFFSGIGSGFTARWYEPLGDTGFWLLHAGLALATTALYILLGPALRRRMDLLDAETGEQTA